MGVKKITHPNGTNTPDEIVVEYAIKDNAGNVIKDTYAKSSDLSEVATSGSYADLSNKPTIPTNADYVDKTTNQIISGQKDFNVVPRVKVTHQTHNLPETYQEVEYLQSSGTQFIDSGYVPNGNSKVIFDSILGVGTATSDIRQGRHADGQRLSIALVTSKLEFAIGGYLSVNYNTTNQRHTYELDVPSRQGKMDGTILATFSASSWTSQQTLYFFARHMSSGQDGLGNVRNYSIEVYEQDQLIRQYIPCYRKSDDEPGMYDTVNDVFYTNIGTGTFIVGPDIYPIAYESLLTDASFATVAKSGNYNDLINKPTIPTVNNATLTIQKNGTNIATFTANQSSNVTANIEIPQEIYWCTYGITTYNDIMSAYNAGKLPAIKYVFSGNIEGVYTLSQVWSDRVVFTYSDSSAILYHIAVRNSNSYTPGRSFVELSSNKVTSISSESTNTQYPSAKCVYDNIENVREVAEGKAKTYVISDITNPLFNSQNDTVSTVNPITDIAGNQIAPISMNIGDVVYVKETDVPDRWVSSINVDTASITNLTGTTWLFNDRIDLAAWASAGLDAFVYVSFTDGTGTANTYMRRVDNYTFYYSSAIAWYSSGGWSYGDIRRQTVTFTGGTASTNTAFIDWVKANATLQSDTYKVTFEKLETAKPTISSISVNGTNVAPILSNVDITVPTKTSDLTNDSGFITSSDLPITDVQVDGTTIINNKIANLTSSKLTDSISLRGAYSRFYGIGRSYSQIYLASAMKSEIDNRTEDLTDNVNTMRKGITERNIDYAVKQSLVDSKTTAYSDAEKISATTTIGAENTQNKTNVLSSSSTNSQYPSAKCVYDNIQDVREVAEGLKQTYVVNITNNPTLNSENDSINLLSPLVLLDDSEVSFNNFQIGDTIYIQDLNVPDRWVSDFLNKIEIANGTEGNSTQSSESYPTPTNPIPVISSIYYNADYQPVELRGISTAKDIYNNGVITRKIGFIDLGTVHWTYTGIGQHTPYGVFSTVEIPNILSIQLNVSGTFIAKCNKYRVSSSITSFPSLAAINNSVFRACNGGYTGLKVNIVDGSKTGNDLVNGIASWLSGTYLYYELYEPTTENTRLYNIGETVGMVLSKLETVKPNIASISVNGTNVAPINENVDITVPTKTSDLTNDSDFVTADEAHTYPVGNTNYRIQFKVVNGQPQLVYEEVV